MQLFLNLTDQQLTAICHEQNAHSCAVTAQHVAYLSNSKKMGPGFFPANIPKKEPGRLRSGSFYIPAGLQVEQRGVDAAQRQQVVVRSRLDHGAGVKHHDEIGHAHGGKPVRDQQRDAFASMRAQAIDHRRLR